MTHAAEIRAGLRLAGLLTVTALAADAALAAGLESRAFLELAPPPANYRDLANDPFAISAVTARDDGLAFVGGRERQQVHVIDVRDPAAPREVCRFPVPDDACGLELAAGGTRLWVGGDDQDADVDGLVWVDVPADPFSAACAFTPVAVPGVESGAFPRLFVADGGAEHVVVAGRFCQAPAVVFVEAEGASPRVVATWSPANPRARVNDVQVTRTPDGDLIGVVATSFAGVHLLDLNGFPAAAPSVLAHYDWTYPAPDLDGDGTPDACERNGDGDELDCGEGGREPDGLRWNAVTHAALVTVGGVTHVVTLDTNLGGHVRIWSLADVLSACPGPDACPDDVDCLQSIPNCPPSAPPDTCPPWPDVDRVRPVAAYQLPKCPLGAWDFQITGSTLLIAHADEGVHVIDLAAQGLPDTAPPSPLALVPLASFDTLPGDSDSILENYPCHATGQADDCESANRDWDPSPCEVPPQPGAAFRVVSNAGLRSATDVVWAGCRVLATDQGTPDADGLPAPSHVGTPQGLWVLELTPDSWPAEAAGLRVARSAGDAGALELSWALPPLAPGGHVLRGILPPTGLAAPTHDCVAQVDGLATTLADQATTDAGVPRPDYHYVVTAACAELEGSPGFDSLGRERPPAGSGCP